MHFSIYLQATECPANRSAINTIHIHPAGLQESLTIDVSYICDCECLQDDVSILEKYEPLANLYDCGRNEFRELALFMNYFNNCL